jgi:hypothetical protein
MEGLVVVEIFKKAAPFLIILGGCVSNPPVVTTNDQLSPAVKNNTNPQYNPIKGIEAKDWRPDPFEPRTKLVLQEIPASELALNKRLASYPSYKNVENVKENLLPLPQFQRRITGIMYNGAISAILETIVNDQILHEVVSPGSKVYSGIKNLDLTVSTLTKDYLILRADDGRTVKVSLSGASPNLLNDLKSKF